MAIPTHEGTPPAASGLPQFDPQWWPGQIFWFLVIFTVVFLLMRYVFVPKIGGTIEARDGRIEGDIAEARALKEQADAEARSAAAETAAARAASQKLAADARDKAKAEPAARPAQGEAKLGESIEVAEGQIRAAPHHAQGYLRAIPARTRRAIVAT